MTECIPVTIRVSQRELREIDKAWRHDYSYKNRTEYIRHKLGLSKKIGEDS